MIRKDLQRLEREGKIKRTYGGAILERESSYDEKTNSRVFVDLESKSYLGKLVLDIIEDNDVIFRYFNYKSYYCHDAWRYKKEYNSYNKYE